AASITQQACRPTIRRRSRPGSPARPERAARPAAPRARCDGNGAARARSCLQGSGARAKSLRCRCSRSHHSALVGTTTPRMPTPAEPVAAGRSVSVPPSARNAERASASAPRPPELMSAVMPQDHRVARIVLPALVVLAVAATVATWLNVRRTHRETERRIADLAQAQQRLERAVHLFRLERGSKGLGVTAPLEQLRHWAPLLQLSTTPQHQLPAIQERADDILLALEDHGADAF